MNARNAAPRAFLLTAVVMMLVLSSVSSATALFVTTFGGGNSQSAITFSGAGTDNTTNFLVPANGTVTWTMLRLQGNGKNITADIGEDGTVDWAFNGKGYGSLGKQTLFSDGVSEWTPTVAISKNASKNVLIPRAATVTKANIKLERGGTANMTWENDRYFTVLDGRNIVELGFKDKAYLAPDFEDYDNDGNPDLIVGYGPYNPGGASTLGFYKGLGLGSNPSFEENTTFSTVIPSELDVHPVLADVDLDGDLDLVYGSTAGTLKFYKHDGTIQNPVWTLNTTLFSGIDVGTNSAPTFADLHNDNKLDLIIGNGAGDFTLYNNTGSVNNPAYTLNATAFSTLHIASGYATPTFGDLDGDQDLDMVSGAGNGNVLMFQNNGSKTEPLIQANTTFFDGVSIFNSRSSPALGDIDKDNDLDVIVGYQNPRLLIWKNQRGEGFPVPWALYNGYTYGDIALNGAGSAIEMADLNGDGFEDLVEVTTDSKFYGFDQKTSMGEAIFQANGSTFNGLTDAVQAMDPTFWDLDNDGDLDMLCGNADGTLTFFRNTGNKRVPTWQKVAGWAPVTGIDVGTYSAPELGDLDGNGLPDLIIGAEAGTLKYYTNTGNAANPTFTSNTTLFGTINYGAGSRAIPELEDIDGDGDLDMFITYFTASGYSTVPDFYNNTGTVNLPIFTLKTSVIGSTGYIMEGAHLSFVDKDRDGDKDMLQGGDPIKRLYFLDDHAFFNIKFSIDTVSLTIDQEAKTKVMSFDITNQLSQALGASTGTNDAYGNSMAPLKFDLKALRSFKAKATIDVDYTYTAVFNNLSTVLNNYITAQKAYADADGMVKVPIKVASESSGTVTFSAINITVDQPPRILRTLKGFGIDEDTRNDKTIDLRQIFADDFTPAASLVLTLETKPGPVSVTLNQSRYVVVDAQTGTANDNWFGQVPVCINATDSIGHTTSTGWFNITVRSVNDPPVIKTKPTTTAMVGTLYTYLVNATDVDNDLVNYGLSVFPKGMTINASSGLIQWTPTASDVGPNTIILTAMDGKATTEQNYSLVVAQRPVVNNPPVITSTPETLAYVGMLYEYQVVTTDEEGDTINYIIPPAKRPAGMAIDYSLGKMTWTPTANQIGTWAITIIASDPYGNTTQNFTLTVDEINLPPKFSSSPKTTANVDVLYSYKAVGSDPEGRTLNFSIASGPTGMQINKVSGEVTWTPTAAQVGTVQVKLEVSDGKLKANQTYNIMVTFVQPSIYLSSPKDKAKVSGTITVKGTARITVGSIVKVQVKVDDKEWKDAKGTTDWTYSLNTKKLSDGRHTITVRSVSQNTESEMRTIAVEVKNESGGLGDTMTALLLVVVLVIVAVVVVVVIIMMKRKKPKAKPATPSETPASQVAAAPQVEQAPAVYDQGVPQYTEQAPAEAASDDEMAQDLQEMQQQEMAQALPTDEEVANDLKELEKVESKLAGKGQQ